MSTGSATPQFLWNKRTGRILSRNNIIVEADSVFVGTCGHHWNEEDGNDGVGRWDRHTGDSIWFRPTGADVNEIVCTGEHLICPTDAGSIFVLDSASGDVASIHHLDSAALSRPLVWHHHGDWRAVTASAKGTVYGFGPPGSDARILGELREPVRANPVDIGSYMERAFIVATKTGCLVRCEYIDHHFTAQSLSRIKYHAHRVPNGAEPPNETGTIHAAPAMAGHHLYVPFARDSYYKTPPLVCVDTNSGEIIWRASTVPGQGDVGNCRTTPIVDGSNLVAALAYSNSLHIFDRATGALRQTVELGPTVYQQWSAPAHFSAGRVVIGRVDGVLSVVDVTEGKLIASVSLATKDTKYSAIGDDSRDKAYDLTPGRRALGICGTPTVLDGIAYVGTASGDLVAIQLGI